MCRRGLPRRKEKETVVTDNYKGLKIKTLDEAVEEAISQIERERTGEQLGLYCRWDGINRGQGKYWRFNHITLLAAPSGHGKSYAVNQLTDDFTELKDFYANDGTKLKEALNRGFAEEVVHIHFGFEMDAGDEVLRNIARKSKMSYAQLLSSEWNYEEQRYNIITDEELADITDRMNYLKGRNIYYIEVPGNVYQIFYTVQYIQQKHPNAKLIISLDHYLLTKKKDERTDMELVAAVAHVMLGIRKMFKAMIIIVGQMNNEIKTVARKASLAFHYPLDSDVYMGAQINWVCDNIWIFPYRPELINIKKYGVDKLDTNGLIVAACVKSRKGRIGDVYMREELRLGRFVELSKQEIEKLINKG